MTVIRQMMASRIPVIPGIRVIQATQVTPVTLEILEIRVTPQVRQVTPEIQVTRVVTPVTEQIVVTPPILVTLLLKTSQFKAADPALTAAA
tara:strand:+ start:258 stop:530 length:273 start_codon:yes stop_codon:yes gene_type:complete